MEAEIWKPIPGVGGYYEASSLGRIKSLSRVVPGKQGATIRKPGRMLKACVGKNGYLYHCIRFDGQKKGMKVHRLVGFAFGIIKNREPINHIDGDKTNNRPSNLEATNPTDNNRHAWRTGLKKYNGSSHYRSKLNEEQVRQILTKVASGEKHISLAKKFGVSSVTIDGIAKGKTWRHLNDYRRSIGTRIFGELGHG